MPRKSTNFSDSSKDNVFGKSQKKGDPEEQYKKFCYAMRVRLVSLARGDYPQMVQFLIGNESLFKTFPDTDKECLRRTVQRSWEKSIHSTVYDSDIFDRILGSYVPVSYSRTIPEMKTGRETVIDDPLKLTIDRQLFWFGDSTYETFWNWINSPATQHALLTRPELCASLYRICEEQKLHSYQFKQDRKTYEPSDDLLYKELITKMEQAVQ